MTEARASDGSAFELSLERAGPMRWMGWRLRLLVVAAVFGLLATFALLRLLATSPHIDASWQPSASGATVLVASPDAALQAHIGRSLVAISAAGGPPLTLEAAALQRPPRWIVDDGLRAHEVMAQRQLAAALAAGRLTLHFDDGSPAAAPLKPRGYAGLGVTVWIIAALAALLLLSGAVVVLARPTAGGALYLLMAACQWANLLLLAAESAPGLGLPAALAGLGFGPRASLDLVTAAAVVHATALLKPRLPGWRWRVAAAWGGVTLAVTAVLWPADLAPVLPPGSLHSGAWWWTQALLLGLGALAINGLTRAQRLQPHPRAVVLRRLCRFAVATLALLTLAAAIAWAFEIRLPAAPQTTVAVAAAVWSLLLAALLLLLPLLSRSRRALREFAMLAGISTVATSLDLLFVAVFSLSQVASLTLAVVLACAAYASARQWLLAQMAGGDRLDIERTFEHLFEVAREAQMQPERHAALLLQVLRELFEPLEVLQLARTTLRAQVVGDGAVLLVPMPTSAAADGSDPLPQSTMALRYARRGKRMFSAEDARLTDRIVEQLRRAVAYDKAVERGRSEERLRIAQDLHDDIGARLLTLMYQAPTPEIEEYIRHTLLDLKTLTRGLAASEHRLSWASAEWKADIAHRLAAARLQLDWSFEIDQDMPLGVVQWSALTRVLRELVSNTIYHARASRVAIAGQFESGRLTLRVTDDGNGRAPAEWSHGLGLGGVRKRVKALGGSVSWRENTPRGIVCEVVVPDLAGGLEPG